MARTLVAIDTTPLNIGSDIVCKMTGASDGPVTVSTDLRGRAFMPPRLDSLQFNARQRGFIVYRARGSTLTVDEFMALVYGLFNPDRGARVLSMRTDPNDEDTEYRAVVTVNSFGEQDVGVIWGGTFEFTEPDWLAKVPVTSSANPLTVGGNVGTRPVITLDGGTACTRRRLTVRDRTGHGIASWPLRVASANNQAFVFVDGVQVPYAVDGSGIVFRAAAKAGQAAFVDVYTGTGVTNSDYANRLDPGGLDLAELVAGSAEVAVENVQANPRSAALSFRPGITTRHPDSRAYTFGMDGDEVVLVDREATGEKLSYPDDADSLVLSSPVEMSQVTVSFDVETGYIAGALAAGGSASERVMRVTIADIDGPPTPENEYGTVYWSPNNGQFTTDDPGSSTDGGHNFPWYFQWTFGAMTFPHTFMRTQSGGEGTVVPRWYNVAGPADFPALAEEWIGCEVTTGEAGVYYLHFPDDAFHGVDIPLLSMSISNREIERTISGDVDIWPPDAGPKPAELFEAVWVDPVTLEPIEEGATAAASAAQTGTVRAVVKYLPRAGEDWITAWSQNVSGSPESVSQSFEDVTVQTPGAVAVAVGLEASAALPNRVDWGRLSMTAPVEIAFDTSKTPQVSVASVTAQRLNGVLRNATTGQQLAFTNVFADGDGLEVDAANLALRGAGGVGPVYGEIQPSGGVRLFDLVAGDNSWTNTTGASVSFEWAERLRI